MHPEDYSQQIGAYYFACIWIICHFSLCALGAILTGLTYIVDLMHKDI